VPRPIAEQRLLGITSQVRAVEVGGEVFLKVVVARPCVPHGSRAAKHDPRRRRGAADGAPVSLVALVFFASIAVPMLKLFGLSVMLVTIQTGRAG
jgi:hypothetical protein